jgi:hypothetical protein
LVERDDAQAENERLRAVVEAVRGLEDAREVRDYEVAKYRERQLFEALAALDEMWKEGAE